LLIGMQIAGVSLFEDFKVCIFLALAGVVLLFPMDYWWWGVLGWSAGNREEIGKAHKTA